ncbi:nicotinate (nicotinamide) nucleotide adenylyltransferase [Hymenobacter canadensis]|uniref:Probable nicotinate-nucleotide adenylyltransferase n=1 Tax=Hymenobacter canadensis TaxID=2999067 RepID=A0ABY7LJI7_9BACT|nr:nicotinate (nicotinamide) nucleotide adenylyltransferase [Hymenobacter canadensis]WBA40595.1 nicotinate (nicotinamide) nucleotide adenylyltransferase [Hymenobacter canadensis]
MSSEAGAQTGSSGKIGLLFGSFNPIHTGHLILAQYMATHTDLSAVWLVVSPQSPYKLGHDLLPEQDRLALAQDATADNELLSVSDVELRLPKPSYTITTLDEIRRLHPGREFVLLMGSDNLLGLDGWRDAGRIRQEFGIYVYPRPGHPVESAAVAGANIKVVDAPLLDISATLIRQSLQEGKSIRYLVPDAVEKLIAKNGYWQQ